MAGPQTSQLLALRVRLETGDTWRSAAHRVGLALSTAFEHATRLWPSLRGRRPRLSAERRTAIEQAILDATAGESYRRIARCHGVSPDTVSRLARVMVDRQCEDLEATRSCKAYRCDGCGHRVTVAPCVICRATGVLDAARH